MRPGGRGRGGPALRFVAIGAAAALAACSDDGAAPPPPPSPAEENEAIARAESMLDHQRRPAPAETDARAAGRELP